MRRQGNEKSTSDSHRRMFHLRAHRGDDKSQKEVGTAFNQFIAAFNNLDWDAFRNTFADDIHVWHQVVYS
jgi:hypothetical protein